MMHGSRYEQVAQPTNVTIVNNTPAVSTTTTTTLSSGLNVVDVNGIRYYTRDSHYYRRDVNGQLLEVTPPL